MNSNMYLVKIYYKLSILTNHSSPYGSPDPLYINPHSFLHSNLHRSAHNRMPNHSILPPSGNPNRKLPKHSPLAFFP